MGNTDPPSPSLIRFLHNNQLHPQDLTEAIPSINVRKQNRIPSVWSTEHVTKLLKAIDRGNPAGKRDYAMILLVARLGMRSIDLKRLKLENLKWQENRITLVQSKTSRELHLPLLPDVGWAIIDYLKHGRPNVDSPFVFLRHLAPLEPFADEHHLHRIIEKYMKLAKIPISPHKSPEEKRHAFFTAYAGQPTSIRCLRRISSGEGGTGL